MTTGSLQGATQASIDEKIFKDNILNLLQALSEREQYVITRRFAIDQDERQTLDKIGKHFSITRERVRQIENNALKKLQRIAERTKSTMINSVARTMIEEHGGVMIEEDLVAKLLNLFSDPSNIDASFIRLSLSADSGLKGVGNTINYYPYWKLNAVTKDLIKEVSNAGYSILNKETDIVDMSSFMKKLQKTTKLTTDKKRVLSIMEIDKRIKVLQDAVGLRKWRHIHPRTLRDKIHFVLRDEKKPLHFVKISNKISELQFDQKTINMQAVHNELIRCSDFVLIGRGLYALNEWGYEHGTISDIIESVLKEKGQLSRKEIVDEVLKKRKVKRISVVVTLKNKAQFVRTGRDVYELKK